VAAVWVGKAAIGLGVAWGCGAGLRHGVLIGLGLAQVGEFALVLAREGQLAGVLSTNMMSMTLSAALLSMVATPFSFRLAPPVGRLLSRWSRTPAALDGPATCGLRSHVVVAGFGRRGEVLARFLHARGVPVLVVDGDARVLARLAGSGIATWHGALSQAGGLAHAELACARLLVARPPGLRAAERIIAHAREVNPAIKVIVSTDHPSEVAGLREAGADEVLHPGFVTGLALLHSSLLQLHWPTHEIHGYLAEIHQSGVDEALDHVEEAEAADEGTLGPSG
jgi:CPA2 family monovalent cation:H+ antiporter-2